MFAALKRLWARLMGKTEVIKDRVEDKVDDIKDKIDDKLDRIDDKIDNKVDEITDKYKDNKEETTVKTSTMDNTMDNLGGANTHTETTFHEVHRSDGVKATVDPVYTSSTDPIMDKSLEGTVNPVTPVEETTKVKTTKTEKTPGRSTTKKATVQKSTSTKRTKK